MSDFIEKVDENSNYTKVYRFIQEEFALNEVIDRMTVWERYFSRTNDSMNGEFRTHYERAIYSLLEENKIRRCATDQRMDTFVIQNPEIEKNEQKVKDR